VLVVRSGVNERRVKKLGKTSISLLLAHAGARLKVILMLVMFNVIAISTSAQSAVGSRDPQGRQLAHATVSPNSPQDSSQDEYADLKLSSSVRYLAHFARLSPETTLHLSYDFNFVLMLALILWKGGPLLSAALQARSRSIRRAIDEAQQLSQDARKRLAEVEKRWAQLDSAIAAIQAHAEAEMKNEERVLTARTTEDIRRILEYSQFEIGKVAEGARCELKAFAADLAVSLARQSIRIDERTDQELVKGLIQGLGRKQFAQTTSQPPAQAVANA
jgi:F0F1-type ATP synthase membrane subunit b/b'